MDNQKQTQLSKEPPQKSCVITIMFGIANEQNALDVKHVIDKAVQDINPKRYSFQINDNT